MPEFEIKLIDNSGEVLKEMERLTAAGLEALGLTGERHAKEGAPVGTTRSTGIRNYHGGSLKKSLTHKVVDNEVYVGTNMSVTHNGKRHPYPLYVEMGTGIYAAEGNGRKSPWRWQDKNGKWHYTRGIKPTHFLKKAVSSPKHVSEYKRILQAVYTGNDKKI